MRKAHNDVDFIFDDNKALIGVCLGYDYCAEHEWGIKGIKQALGIWSGEPKTERKVFGRCRHIMTKADAIRSGEVMWVPYGKKKELPAWFIATLKPWGDTTIETMVKRYFTGFGNDWDRECEILEIKKRTGPERTRSLCRNRSTGILKHGGMRTTS